MILADLTIPGHEGRFQLQTEKGTISRITKQDGKSTDGITVSCGGAAAFPGLINSHDHLDFNLFPPLRARIYRNYREWGPEIRGLYAGRIGEVLRIPSALRTRWGVYKNLLNGFTTVVNHGKRLDTGGELLSVWQDDISLHSPAFERNWKWKINNPFHRNKIVMHLGEGVDDRAGAEIDEVIRFNKWKRKFIAVHGVAMTERQAGAFEGVVWCPASNYFLLGKTADVQQLRAKTQLVFGTDSTLTAEWNAWKQFREGIRSGEADTNELIAMLTSAPALLWDFKDRGTIAPGMRADLLLLPQEAKTDFTSMNPRDILLVLHKGEVRVIDQRLFDSAPPPGFTCILFDGAMKWVQGDLRSLVEQIRSIDPNAFIPFDLV